MHPRSTYAVLLLCLATLIGCGKSGDQGTSRHASNVESPSTPSTTDIVKAENARLQAEVKQLRLQVASLELTPSVLLGQVTEALAADQVSEASRANSLLLQRYPDSTQTRAASAALSKYAGEVATRLALARAIESKGFYALQPQSAPIINGVTVKVESLQMGARWQFDAHGDEWHFRDAERGERFVLLRTTLQSKDKSPQLPDVGIYRIEGKKMTRVGQLRYEFRRWSTYGSFIGLHHDFKNDFAHSEAVPFNAAASISDDDAKAPFAVIATGESCHERGSRIGQPEVMYSPRYNCASKTELTIEDFATGGYRVLAYFNRPKGSGL